jgi:hypothetical protein
MGVETREAKPHRNHGDPPLVVELGRRDIHPLAQAIARGIAPRHAGGMDADPWRLSADGEPRRRTHPQDRPGLMGQWAAIRLLDAVPACPDFGDEPPEFVGHGRRLNVELEAVFGEQDARVGHVGPVGQHLLIHVG